MFLGAFGWPGAERDVVGGDTAGEREEDALRDQGGLESTESTESSDAVASAPGRRNMAWSASTWPC